ncbi:type I secretion system permease/ATPase [Sediminicoccus rosea]|jgi:PrtD family type I secretion system ABC transporter|uniref:Type I secretion system permease/ATPase n=1 Tax=Sediminicoccus rosea TaxID=1225128 RepID=A0ABZ0PJ52_9PROT|nr:type I secretion system permease/ATPase [Sediminicoccus rosea]WPB85743.1 type I secretion system permease/ATPase [Sediminicoccus rosea]
MSGTQAARGAVPLAETPLGKALAVCRRQFWLVAAFSGVVNLLQLTVSIYMMQVFDRVLATRNTDTLLYLTLVAIFALMILAMLEAVRSVIMQRIAAWVEHRVAPEGFMRAVEGQLRGGNYRMEALRDLGMCRAFLGSPGMLALFDLPWVPVYIGLVFLLHPMLGWLALGGAIILFILTLTNEAITSKALQTAGVAAMQGHRRAEAIARNAEVIDSMGMMPAVLRRWRGVLANAQEPQETAADRAAIILSLIKFFRLAVQLAVLGLGAWLVLQQELTSGASIAASIVMGRALAPVEQVVGSWKQLVQARSALRRLKVFLTMPRLRPAGMPLPAPRGDLSVERVSYNFPGQNVSMIKGVSFALAAGESLAIIGPSAAGKTTLVRMLIGTLPPTAGAVRLDGADVFLWQREDFGRYLGYLPQDVELFEGTVFDNIARLSEAEPEAVFEAAKLAGCHEMILRLPAGYETEIGDAGAHLSGGQRQLVGLARALFGAPRLVVLDEPNSNLDGDSEAALGRALQRLKAQGVTVVLVSHRPALVQEVDKVLVMKDGAAELFGPRAEVLKRLSGPPRPVQLASAGGSGA